MKLFTMETRCYGDDEDSKASLTCEVDNMGGVEGDFRSVLYFDLDNKGPNLTKQQQQGRDLNGNGFESNFEAEDGAPSKTPLPVRSRYTPRHAQLLTKQIELKPVQFSETMTVSAIPNYEERYVSTWVEVGNKRRFIEKVNFEPTLCPVNYAQSIICYRNSTRKKFLSHVQYEPRVRPRRFSDSLFVLPKSAETTYLSVLDYHIDECKRWFKSSVELKAKTYTTSRIQHEKPAMPRYSVTVTKQPKETVDGHVQQEAVVAMPPRTNDYIHKKLSNGNSNGFNQHVNGDLKDDNDNYYDGSEC